MADTDIFDEAAALMGGDRQESYGDCVDNHRRIALIFSGILGIEVSAHQAALLMEGVKLAREAHRPKRDNRVDGAAYWRIADACAEAGQV
jgi:hypothetical protein